MLEIIITSSVLILVLTFLRRLWRGRISQCLQYGLWLIVAARLLIPIPLFENRLNIMNVVNRMVRQAESWSDEREKSAVRGEDSAETQDSEEAFKEGLAGVSGWEEARGNSGTSDGQTVHRETAAGDTNPAAPGSANPTAPTIMDVQKDSSAMPEIFAPKPPITKVEAVTVRRLLRYIWYAGIACMAVWMIVCNVGFRHRLLRNRTLLSRKGRLRIYVAEDLDSPCLCAGIRPAVYLTPSSMASPQTREHSLAHELTHYRHLDHVWSIVRSLCLVIYWFHPLVWLAVKLSVTDCELACDEGTIRRLGEGERQNYGCTLIGMSSIRSLRKEALRCAPGFSGGKKELKERITLIAAMRRKSLALTVLAVACAALLAACSFGKTQAVTGRYDEAEVELDGSEREFVGLSREGMTIRLVSLSAEDVISFDGGNTFVKDENQPSTYRKWRKSMHDKSLAVTPKGDRLFLPVSETLGGWRIVTGEGKEIPVSGLPAEYGYAYYGGGYFYVSQGRDSTTSIYRITPDTGEVLLLMEGNYYSHCIAADEEMLYAVLSDGLRLYDLEEGKAAERQDAVLSDFLLNQSRISPTRKPVIYPYGAGVYVLTSQGLYWHELYGDDVELVIDSALCGSISDSLEKRGFEGMTVLEKEGGKPDFLICYSDGSLMRYSFDEALESSPPILRVYSVYEDPDVRRAISAYLEQHPGVYIKYEIGMLAGAEDTGMTVDDVLKKLTTELAAGKGPDILVMDSLPYDSYVEKGVLMDLASLREGMGEEDYFLNVIDGLSGDDGLYAVPLSFVIPVLCGDPEELAEIGSLSDLADHLERAGAEIEGEGAVFPSYDKSDIFLLLSLSSQGAWVEDGVINREALTEFLTAAKRIYDVQMRILPEKYRDKAWGTAFESEISGLDQKYSINSVAVAGLSRKGNFFPDMPLSAGFVGNGVLGANTEDFALFLGMLETLGDEYVMMPGQQYGTCLVQSLLAVNAASTQKEESLGFLEYVLSDDFQGSVPLNGNPVNRNGHNMRKQRPEGSGSEDEIFSGSVFYHDDGTYDVYYIYWPTEEKFNKLDNLLNNISGVNYCDNTVFHTVIETGMTVLSGEVTVEEAVDEIVRKLQLYLAE